MKTLCPHKVTFSGTGVEAAASELDKRLSVAFQISCCLKTEQTCPSAVALLSSVASAGALLWSGTATGEG